MLPSHYAYISAKIRGLEKQLPDATDIERMIDAPDFGAAFKVFNDTDYADNLLDVEPNDYYQALADDLKQLKSFIQKNVPDKRLQQLIFLKEDFNNVKILIKTLRHKNTENPPAEDQSPANTKTVADNFNEGDQLFGRRQDLSPLGNIEPEQLILLIKENKNPDPKNNILLTIVNIIVNIKPDTPSWEIDAVVDKACYDLALKLAKKIRNRAIIDYFKKEIEAINLKIILRVKYLMSVSKLGFQASKPSFEDRIAKSLIPGGSLAVGELTKLADKEDSELLKYIGKNFDRQAQTETAKIIETSRLDRLDLVINYYLHRLSKQISKVTYGPEIIFNYVNLKLTALHNIRLIMIGKINNIPSEEIKNRIIL